MRIAVVERSHRGGLFLRPNHFGNKIEFIARKCGKFKEGEVVIALECTHDTKPEDPRRGARFIRVRRLTSEDYEVFRREAQESFYPLIKTRAINTQNRALVVEESLFTRITVGFGEEEVLLMKKKKVFDRKYLKLSVDYSENEPLPSIEISNIKEKLYIEVPDHLVKKILEDIFQHDIASEREKSLREQEAAEAEYKRKMAEAAAKREAEEKRRIKIFFAEYPEAKKWFPSQPTWKGIKEESIRRKVATFVRKQEAYHYAKGCGEDVTFYDRIWEIRIGNEKIQFIAGSLVEYE